MKSKDIAKMYAFERGAFERFISEVPSYAQYKSGLSGYDIPDPLVDELAAAFNTRLMYVQNKQEEARLEAQREEAEKQRALSQMLITSGFTFDGYKIVKYSGYMSGDDVAQLPRETKFFAGTSSSGTVGEELTKALVKIRRQALKELKEAAYDLGCNAVIGVDFDYITLEPETSNISGHTVYLPFVFCVTANGNAVVIEKIPD